MNKIAIAALVLAAASYLAGRLEGIREHEHDRTIIIDHEQGIMALTDTDAGAQTVSRLDGQPTGLYYDFAALIPAFRPDAKNVLMFGVGGGEMFKVLRRAGYRGHLTGVDNATDTEANLRSFSVEDVTTFQYDALAFADRFENPAGYEGIIVDLYVGPKMSVEQSSPALYYAIAHRLLARRGVVLVNVAHRADVGPVAQAMHEGGLRDVYAMRAGDNTMLLGMVVDDWGGVDIPLALVDSVNHRWTP